MALSRFVLTATVTIAPDTLAALVAGEPGTGGAAGRGNVGTVAPGTSGKYGWLPSTFQVGTAIYADSSGGTTGPALLYQAIGAGNLRAYVQGQDDVGHGGLSN
ncbi:MAG: hypothetical protein M3Y33_09205 [Actinomycetota bacterium]|nr:hypothetical protein [Actinomycetota bacterium]